MKLLRSLWAFTTIVAIGISALWLKQTFYSDEQQIDLGTPSVEKIQTLSALVTHKVYLNVYLEGANEDYSGIWQVKGDALTSVDLSNIQLTNLDEKLKTATLHLPPPTIISPRIDQEQTSMLSLKGKGLPFLRKFKNKAVLLEQVMEQAQKKIAEVANSPEILENARKEATEKLQTLYKIVGWELNIQWNDQVQLL